MLSSEESCSRRFSWSEAICWPTSFFTGPIHESARRVAHDERAAHLREMARRPWRVAWDGRLRGFFRALRSRRAGPQEPVSTTHANSPPGYARPSPHAALCVFAEITRTLVRPI